jgi:Uma2 family endonuclease
VASPALNEPETYDAFERLTEVEYWTGRLALELLPELNGPRIEVIYGSLVVAPHAGGDHQNIELELAYPLKAAARRAGFWLRHEMNILGKEELFIPDIVVLRSSPAGQAAMNAAEVLLVVEIVSEGSRKKDLIDRPKVYAALEIPWFMRVEFRKRVPAVVLHQLIDGEYTPIVAAAAGTTFTMKEPFEFSIDPGHLLDD